LLEPVHDHAARSLIGAHVLLEILMDAMSIPVSALLFTPLRAARD
jgi:hypothetical protein